MQEQSPENPEKKPSRGRPKLSHLSSLEQAKTRMQKMRERKRDQMLVPVEIWIPEPLRDWLLKDGQDLSSFAQEALEALAKTRGY